ncbi:hypothetical protein GCM10010218_56010 [Streptomyces mashuensis]|uniref:SnoaL-like domain-containing protein n=1 Tax=Streptomyces mashuensis TaxID=33904 RepID=A0A919EFW2_9ACTN|nr:nuclear transport factor 2 family protein [Streptomyces mashuensis]GHF67327.1 hypothetical protein GCM10010218_56010 [Streptomyces mashuensis]
MNAQPDHAALTTLVNRFFRSLDERRIDEEWARTYLTDDVRTVTPIGTTEGAAATVRHTATALGRFARTQHVATGVLVDGDPATGHATVSWNAVMTHVHHDATLRQRGAGATPLFTVGAHYETDVVRTPAGWRFHEMRIEPVWTTGEPPVLPEEAHGRTEA